MTRPILKDTGKGEVITARKLTSITRAINENTKAIAGPREVLQQAEELETNQFSLMDESYTAAATDITSTTVTITDSASNTHDIERIDTIVFTESTTGKKLTLSITYT